MDFKWVEIIRQCYKKGITLAGTTSVLYHKGFTGLRYMELRKYIEKEFKRIESIKQDELFKN